MNKIRVLLDSTYLLPALGIEIVEGWTKKNLLFLLQNEALSLYYVDLSLFEIYTKILKLIIQKKITADVHEIQKAFDSIVVSNNLKRIKWYNHLVDPEFLLKMKELHEDSIDCMLFYISLLTCDCFATYDLSLINNIRSSDEMIEWVKDLNPEFTVWLGNLNTTPEKLIK